MPTTAPRVMSFAVETEGKDKSPGVGGGTFHWTGGTGKYSGIMGNGTYRYTAIGKAPAYSVIWEGEWQSP